MLPKINNPHILIVEDEFIIADALKTCLEQYGYRVAGIALNFEKALLALNENTIDFVLIDINLGKGKNGLDLAETINLKYKIPFVFITSNVDDSVLNKAKELDPYGFIVKPFKEVEIKTAIEMALYKHAFSNALKLKEEKEELLEISHKLGLATNKINLLKIVNDILLGYYSFSISALFIVNTEEDNHYWLIQDNSTGNNVHNVTRFTAGKNSLKTTGSGIEQLAEKHQPSVWDWRAKYSNNESSHPYIAYIKQQEIYYAITAPLFAGGNYIGFFTISSKNAFHEGHLAFFKAVTDLLAMPVYNLIVNERLELSAERKSLELKLAKALSDTSMWQEKLLQVAILLQPHIPFGLLVINIEKNDKICPLYAYQRTGSKEYQKLLIDDLTRITKLDQDTFKNIRHNLIKTYEQPFILTGSTLTEHNKNNPIKRNISSYFNFNSNFIYPLRLDKYGKVVFSFYNKEEGFYNDSHLDVFNGFENTLRIVFDRSLALEEISKLNNQLREENNYLLEEVKSTNNFEEIIGHSAALKEVFKNVELVADTETTVLITGETGTGKELIARSVHHLSSRKNKPLIKVNCAALPSQLIESELFGHEKGSFTGAYDLKAGKFELANSGSIFLDEVGELPLELQAKLLRVLQEKEFERIGGSFTIKCDVRVIAATNRNLLDEVQKGTFRADLYYRLFVFPIHLPPLRDRKEDIPLLATFFANKYTKKMNRKFIGFKEDTMKELVAYNWPGNIRELENVIEQAVIINREDTISLARPLVPPFFTSQLTTNFTTNTITSAIKSMDDFKLEKTEKEKAIIIKTLQQTRGKIRGVNGAAELLKIKPTTLDAKLKKYGIIKEQFNILGQ